MDGGTIEVYQDFSLPNANVNVRATEMTIIASPTYLRKSESAAMVRHCRILWPPAFETR